VLCGYQAILFAIFTKTFAISEGLMPEDRRLSCFFENLNPYNFFLYYFYLFGIFWVLPLVRWRRQPPFLRRALLSLPVFIIIYLFFGGILSEPREIVNLYPLLIPAGIFALFGEQVGASSATVKAQGIV